MKRNGVIVLSWLIFILLVLSFYHSYRSNRSEPPPIAVEDANLTERLIISNEGVRRSAYRDTQGNLIIGVGHKITGNEKTRRTLSDAQVMTLLRSDIEKAQTFAKSVFPEEWEGISVVRQAVITDMIFNLGTGGFLDFEHFIANVRRSDWHAAANSLLQSLAARQNPKRYQRNAEALRSNTLSIE